MPPSQNQLDRHRSRLVTIGGVLLSLMSITLVLVSAGDDSQGVRVDFAERWPTLVGLTGIVIVFVLYAQQKHRELAAAERRLRDAAIREATLSARFTELASLFDVSTQLQLRLDLQGMLDLAVQRLVTCFDAYQSSIMLLDEKTETLEVKAVAGADGVAVRGVHVKVGDGIAGHAFASGETLLLTPDVMRRRFPDEIKNDPPILSALCVPMRFRGSPIGVVSVSRTSGEPFGPMHVRTLETFAEHCAANIVKTHHHQEVLKQVRRVA